MDFLAVALVLVFGQFHALLPLFSRESGLNPKTHLLFRVIHLDASYDY